MSYHYSISLCQETGWLMPTYTADPSSATSPYIRYIMKKMNLYGTHGNNLATGDELTTQFSNQSLHLVHHEENESLWYTWK